MNVETAQIWATYIAIFSFIVGFGFNIFNLIKILRDNEPQLCFDLRNYRGDLLLIIKNNGKTKASDIKVNIQKLHNNNNNILCEDFLFCLSFELNSGEQTQGKIAQYGGSFSNFVFPYIDVEISYRKPHKNKIIKYNRQVFFNPQNINEFDEVVCQLNSINKQLDNLRNPILRLANYFDGHQLAPYDEINLITDNSFQSDLYKAIIEKKEDKITSREETIKSRLK